MVSRHHRPGGVRSRTLLWTAAVLALAVIGFAVFAFADRLIPKRNVEYYPGFTVGPVRLWLGPKKSEIIGYAYRQDQPSVIKREWRENGILARDALAFDESGQQVMYSPDVPPGFDVPPRPGSVIPASAIPPGFALYRELVQFFDTEGRLVFEVEYRKGVVSYRKWFWPESGKVRCLRMMRGLEQHGEEAVWTEAGQLVFHARFEDNRLIETISGDPGARERPR